MRRLSLQKMFCFVSVLFIIECCVFYGIRFLKLYFENQQNLVKVENTLVKAIIDNDENNLREINNNKYFQDKMANNYIEYSNILWRIVKINENNEITLISNDSLTSLAYGEYLNFNNSYIFKWLNKTDNDYSGILEGILNEKEKYLAKPKVCIDNIDKLSNADCENYDNDVYVSLLSVQDYINANNKDGFLINNDYFYLSNNNSNKEIWYITDEGKASTSDGTDIIGIRPVITIKSGVKYVSGNGTISNPYKIETTRGLFGSYVKIDDTVWRIYQVNEDDVRLMLDDYLKVDNENVKYRYSLKSSYHDDYKYGSIAYYLNNDFLNTLSCKDKIKEVTWTNGYYGSNSEYDYSYSLNKTIESKVAALSVGDIKLNSKLTNYWTLTGNVEKGSMVYTIQSAGRVYTKDIEDEINIVPTISINRELLSKGNGTVESPYEVY